MQGAPFTLATSAAEPDQDFASLEALARHLNRLRDALPLNPDGRRPELAAVQAQLFRTDLPGGSVVSIRARDGSLQGKGALLGYAFMPADGSSPRGDPARLMAAIVREQLAAEARAKTLEVA